MTKRSMLKNGINLVLLYLFLSVCLTTSSFADDDLTGAYKECQNAANKRFDRCMTLLDKAIDSGDEKIFNKSKKCMEENNEVLDQCRESRKLTFVKNKAWRKNNAKALSQLGKALETADDKCIQAAEKGRDKCDKIKSNKKRATCPVSVEKKKNSCMRKALKSFVAGYKKLKPPTEALEGGGLEKVKGCHITLRDKLRACKNQKCINKYLKAFQRCVKRETKGAAFRKGSSGKKLAASIQKVIDAGKPLYKKCSTKSGAYEKKMVAKAKKRGTLQADKRKIQGKAEAMKQECYDRWQRTQKKAMEAQIRQHFVD